jgi:Mlc titration factor MtfA (ptsG expression regulator)
VTRRWPFSEARRKHAIRREPFPDTWRAIIDRNVVHARVLPTAEREQLEERHAALITDKRWEAAARFTLTDEIQVTIAASRAPRARPGLRLLSRRTHDHRPPDHDDADR